MEIKEKDFANKIHVQITLDAGNTTSTEREIEELKIRLVECIDDFEKDTHVTLKSLEVLH